MLNRILPPGKRNGTGVTMKEIVPFHSLCELRKLFESRGNVQPGDRSLDERGDISVLVTLDFIRGLSHLLVGPSAFSFRGGDEEIPALHRERARVPIGRNESHGSLRVLRVGRRRCRRSV